MKTNRNLTWIFGLQAALIAGLFAAFAASYSNVVCAQQTARGKECSVTRSWLKRSPTLKIDGTGLPLDLASADSRNGYCRLATPPGS